MKIKKIKESSPITKTQNLPSPSDKSIAKISALLEKQFRNQELDSKYAPVKQVLAILGRGAIISAALLAPKAAPLLAQFVEESPDYDAWKHYNVSYLKRTLERLEKQKEIEISKENGQEVIRLSKNGQKKILRLSLDNLAQEKPKKWDGKWRLILYDVPVRDKTLGDIFRQALRTIGCYQLQDSVYLYPYPVFEQIEFLREFYGLGDNVQYMLIEHIERDSNFKTFFNLS